MVKLRDSRSSELIAVEKPVNSELGLYVCGPTVAGKPHLGHLRTAYAYDLLVRWLRLRERPVRFVQNITDIDDKILAYAAKSGEDWRAVAENFEGNFSEMRTALGLLEPDSQPRATEHIPEIIALVERLLENGAAYRATDGSANVYYSVESDPAFGSFTHQSLASMLKDPNAQEGEHSHATGKRHPLDFSLWKAHKEGLEPDSASWDTPWGKGRPGWHVEDTAMAVKELGESFALHGGGRDLRLPHHESEVAQARGAGYPYAAHWIHSGLVTSNKAKMAKSKGNFVLAEESYGRNKNALRLLFTRVHYASDVEYSDKEYEAALASWGRIIHFLKRAEERLGAVMDFGSAHGSLPEKFTAAMDEDLSTPEAYRVIFDLVTAGNKALDSDNERKLRVIHPQVISMVEALGFDILSEQQQMDETVETLLRKRAAARSAGDYALSDKLRDELKLAGVTVRDTKNGQEIV